MPTPDATAREFDPTDRPAASTPSPEPATPATGAPERPRELGGPAGPEPTRYGDWEKAGRCIDF
jgi:hypothetical protein